MHPIDATIIGAYMVVLIGIGVRSMRRQTGDDSFFVGNRDMGWGHIGFSVVATDVGGGFSIGIGGLGFAMGLSGSWLLFTGLVGAWLAAVVVIPRVKPLADRHGWTSYAEFLGHRFDGRTRVLAALVSAIGYASFVGAQIMAGAVLAEGTLGVERELAVVGMAVVVIVYTSLGGIEAVILTDTIQWIVLLFGLAAFALPAAIIQAGGFSGLAAALPAGHLSFTSVSATTLATWAITIVPIWFVANTLYQRIYATRDVATARRAWYLAGLLEWPILALLGTFLGVLGRVLLPELSADQGELAIPMLIHDVLPVGVAGIVIAAYFSAIMSTADSCLLASVGHVVGDLGVGERARPARRLRWSRILSAVIGGLSVAVALWVPTVLEAILLSYSFMISGLLVPTLAALLWPRGTARAAFASILTGGGLAVILQVPTIQQALPGMLTTVDPAFIALPAALLVLVLVSLAAPGARAGAQ